jgi:hypothetical protein
MCLFGAVAAASALMSWAMRIMLSHFCCCLCCCRYVVVEGDGTVAASWQRGANNVLALQLNDEEVEVYDNW